MLLRGEGLAKRIGGRTLFEGVSLHVDAGDRIGGYEVVSITASGVELKGARGSLSLALREDA